MGRRNGQGARDADRARTRKSCRAGADARQLHEHAHPSLSPHQGRARLEDTIMSFGYNRPLYLLPFDHRHSYVTGMFNFNPPLTVDQHEAVADSKRIIYDGFRQALGKGAPIASARLL